MAWFGFGKNKKEEQATQTQEQLAVEQLTKQKELGDKLFLLLKAAAKENTIFNITGEGKSHPIGSIRISNISNNGGVYSIYAMIGDSDSNSNPVILQANINVAQNNINIFFTKYGPETNFTLEKYNDMSLDLINYIKNFRYYDSTFALRKKLFNV
ncbi:MAG: hypothetical protein ACP5N1_02730 [Candidatus Woesearchaeota archaeon]